MIPQERRAERTVEQIGNVLVPQSVDEIVEAAQNLPWGAIYDIAVPHVVERIGKQTVDVAVPQIK